MPDFDPTAYGGAVADLYDELYEGFFDTDAAVGCLRELAGGGSVLELGVGTGRLALPLAAGGLRVHGVDASDAMLALLRAKPGGADVATTQADFSKLELGEQFRLAFIALNTIFALPSQDAQVGCFQCVAEHLEAGGRFVVEAFVPNPGRFQEGQTVRLRHMTEGHVALEIARIDPSIQFMYTNQVHLRSDGMRVHAANHRYAWPAELDLMARIAGLALEDRWQDWNRTPFTATSQFHVSVYRKPAS